MSGKTGLKTQGGPRRRASGAQAFTSPKKASHWSWTLLWATLACAGPALPRASLTEEKSQQASGESTLGNASLFCDSSEECGAVGSDIGCECHRCTARCSDDEACLKTFTGEYKDAIDANVREHLRCLVVPPLCAEERDEAEIAPGEQGTCELVCDAYSDCVELLGSDAVCTPAGICRVPSRQLRCPAGMALVAGEAVEDASSFLAPFCMSATEVTVSQFDTCIQVGSCEATTQGNAFEAQSSSLPIDFVAPEQAEAHCQFLGGSLPTFQQWQWAAQNGTYESLYPWGNGFEQADIERVCSLEDNKVCDVASHPSGDTLTGLADMSGNVAEIVSNEDGYCAAGGSFVAASGDMTDAQILQTNACVLFEEPSDAVGFRCVAEPIVVADGGT